MPQFRKRPQVVEAVRFDPVGKHRLQLPPGVSGVPSPGADNWAYAGGEFFVTTIQGVRTPIKAGEWVVTEPNDPTRHYPCDDATFRRLYEPADPEAGRMMEDGVNG